MHKREISYYFPRSAFVSIIVMSKERMICLISGSSKSSLNSSMFLHDLILPQNIAG